MDRHGEIEIDSSLDQHQSNAIVGRPRDRRVAVPAVTLDGIYRQTIGSGRVRLLKINIEGAEATALQGASTLLEATDAVTISCHDFRADRGDGEQFRTRAEVRRILQGAGFELRSGVVEHPAWHRDTVYGIKPESGRTTE